MRVAPDLKTGRVETHHCGGSAQINDTTTTAGNNKLAFLCARGPAMYRCDRVFATLIISTPDSSGGTHQSRDSPEWPLPQFSGFRSWHSEGEASRVLGPGRPPVCGVWLQAILIRGLYLSDQQRGAPFGAKRMVGGNK